MKQPWKNLRCPFFYKDDDESTRCLQELNHEGGHLSDIDGMVDKGIRTRIRWWVDGPDEDDVVPIPVAKIQASPHPPSDPKVGSRYYNTKTEKTYIYSGTRWLAF